MTDPLHQRMLDTATAPRPDESESERTRSITGRLLGIDLVGRELDEA